MKNRILITSALPYANGGVHIGHLAGAYLPADIYTRFQRRKGREVIHICGTDENGVPITISAEKQGVSPQKIVDKYHNIIKKSFDGFGISFDNFSRTSLPEHYKLAQEFFLKLYNKGYISEKTERQFFCPNCRRFLPDRYVEGTCPYCGYENARGDQCEKCGRWLEPTMLINPKCKICGTTPVLKETKHWYFNLSTFQEKLQVWISEKKHWRDNVKQFVQGWFQEGLKPRAITRDLNWGVPVPLKEAENKVLYVWFDAPIGYISSTIEWAKNKGEPEKWKDYWQSKDTKLVHFIGKDNIIFHAVVWPAMLMGTEDYILPDDIPANEFLNMEGGKISTSRNWAVWLDEYIKEFPPDYMRYYLTIIAPETKDSDFRWKEFQQRVNTELINSLGNFVNRVLTFVKNYFGNIIPRPDKLSGDAQQILKKIEYTVDEIENNIEGYQMRKAIRSFMDLADTGNRYYDASAPWSVIKENPEEAKNIIYTCCILIDALADISEPFIPFSAERIKKMIGMPFREWDAIKTPQIKGGETLNDVKILYKKIENEDVEIQIKKLGKEKKMEQEKEFVTIQDFKKMGLKTGKIISVERVENADKLYKLQVDLGNEKRTLVAGLVKYYSEDELLGKTIIVITNLEPAVIRGIKSEGMLLAAESGEIVSILQPDKDVPPGSEIS